MTETLTHIILITATINLFLIALLTLAVITRIIGRRPSSLTPGDRKSGARQGTQSDASGNRTKAGTIDK